MIYFKLFKFHGSKSAKYALNNMELTDTTGFPLKEEEVALISVNSSGMYTVEGSWKSMIMCLTS